MLGLLRGLRVLRRSGINEGETTLNLIDSVGKVAGV